MAKRTPPKKSKKDDLVRLWMRTHAKCSRFKSKAFRGDGVFVSEY